MIRAFVLCLALVLAVTACSGRPDPRDRRGDISPANLPDERPSRRAALNPADVYTRAIALKEDGNCEAAAPLLLRLAQRGPGFETAQAALGDCQMQLAGDNLEARQDALIWTTRAAEGGWPEAQVDLVMLYADDPAFRDRTEALYWLAVYDANPRKARIGYTPPAPGVLEAVRASATAGEWAEAQARALQFVETPYMPPAPPEDLEEDAPPPPAPEPPRFRR